MRAKGITQYFIAMVGLSLVSMAGAETAQKLQFSGFGTLGVTFNHEDDADYRANSEQSQGVGRTASPDYGVDSVFGFQGDAALFNGLTATAQMQSRRLSDGASSPYFEWANLKYMVTPNLSVRVGRVVAPVFMVSESRSIGYAQTAVRLAPDVYQLAPITYLDGGGVTYCFTAGDLLYRANITHGKIHQSLTVSGELRDYNFEISIASLEAELNASKFRIGYSDVRAAVESAKLSALDGAITAFAAAGIPNADILREHIDFADIGVGFLDIGYEYDRGSYFVQSEFVFRDAESETIQNQQAYYLLGGYRLGTWMPFIQYSRMESKIEKEHLPLLEGSALPLSAETQGQIAAVNASIGAIRRPQERSTWALGARWDVQDNYAIKLQYDRISKDADRLSYFVNATNEFVAEARTVNVYSATLDFVF